MKSALSLLVGQVTLFLNLCLAGAGLLAATLSLASAETLSLNGEWAFGQGRAYTATTQVPGITTDPKQMNDGPLWYRKTITLPAGDWSGATLVLKGARFAPRVYINGALVSAKNGGMAPTYHELASPAVAPRRKITLEIELKSLRDLDDSDASYIPVADHWRSNVSSSLWDDVELHLYKGTRITRMIPHINMAKQQVTLDYALHSQSAGNISGTTTVTIRNRDGQTLLTQSAAYSGENNRISFHYGDMLQPWSPEAPNLHQLDLEITGASGASDSLRMPFGLKEFRTENKQFTWNGKPFKARAGTVVWHRWVRDEEARALAYDTDWFTENIIKRLKDHGANTLRFHLGNPPERFLDLCDQYGLAVQYEWSFSHGMPASEQSLLEQWAIWLDLAMRHPSVALIHPYNETEDDELAIAWSALDKLIPQYPQLVLEDRDVIHIHKYWWSLFENLGLYYDSADQFPKAIMADEFGGNYLDGNGDFGGYKTVKSTYLRFLGEQTSKAERLKHHGLSNSKVAEYWRRIGAAGFSPFTILGSHEDGSHWYMGPLAEGQPKPVWQMLTAAWSPRSISLELWDRNFRPSETVSVPLHFFNDTADAVEQQVRIKVTSEVAGTSCEKTIEHLSAPYSHDVRTIDFRLPNSTGPATINTRLLNRPDSVKHPVVSDWDIHILEAQVPDGLDRNVFGISENDRELKALLERFGLRHVDLHSENADTLIISRTSWQKIKTGDANFLAQLETAINSGKNILMADVGERLLGQGYPESATDLGPLQGVAKISLPAQNSYPLWGDLSVTFTEAAEPESHIHPTAAGAVLWQNIGKQQTRLWNGMRGGLIAPATDMAVAGVDADSWLGQ